MTYNKRLFSLEDKIPYNIKGHKHPELKPDIEEIAKTNITFKPSIAYDILLRTPYHIDPDKIVVQSPSSDPAITKAVEKYIKSGYIKHDNQFKSINNIKPYGLAMEIYTPLIILGEMYPSKELFITNLVTLLSTAAIGTQINRNGCKTSLTNISYLEDNLNKEIEIEKKPKDDIDPIIDDFNYWLKKIGPHLIESAKEKIIDQHDSPENMRFYGILHPEYPHHIDSNTEDIFTTMDIMYFCEIEGIIIDATKGYLMKIDRSDEPIIREIPREMKTTYSLKDPKSEPENIQLMHIPIGDKESFSEYANRVNKITEGLGTEYDVEQQIDYNSKQNALNRATTAITDRIASGHKEIDEPLTIFQDMMKRMLEESLGPTDQNQ